ncbi:MAG: hypothetical protein H8F28_26865 [Fibrella sp.]|nr:hypothetical protein [Armatimonadota bacterium]
MYGQWRVGAPVLSPGISGTFDETAVKDPSVVYFEGQWHVFYTARGRNEYTTGYVAAKTWQEMPDAPRYELTGACGATRYGCAPQIFYFRPHGIWYLLFQTTDANYQPMFVTTKTLPDPASWSTSHPLLMKDTPNKWIDFWILCDETDAYLYYTEDHKDVMVRRTTLLNFPDGWGEARIVFTGVHEAVHVYKAQGRDEFHMIYERNTGDRSFGFARAPHPTGPWTKVRDDYAAGSQLVGEGWTQVVSHGEMLRTGFDERLEYDDVHPVLLIQGLRHSEYIEPYPEMSWKLGIISGESD